MPRHDHFFQKSCDWCYWAFFHSEAVSLFWMLWLHFLSVLKWVEGCVWAWSVSLPEVMFLTSISTVICISSISIPDMLFETCFCLHSSWAFSCPPSCKARSKIIAFKVCLRPQEANTVDSLRPKYPLIYKAYNSEADRPAATHCPSRGHCLRGRPLLSNPKTVFSKTWARVRQLLHQYSFFL